MTAMGDANAAPTTEFVAARLVHNTAASDVAKQIQEQLRKLEKDCDLTSGSDFFMEKQWESWNLRLGIATVVLSALVSVIGAVSALEYFKTSEEYFLLGSTLLASIGTVLGSVLTFLKPSERAARYREFAIKQKNLRNRIRIYRTVHAPSEPEWTKSAEQLASFNMEKDALSSDNPTIPTTAYESSRKAIEAKEANKQANAIVAPAPAATPLPAS